VAISANGKKFLNFFFGLTRRVNQASDTDLIEELRIPSYRLAARG
jgi:hypothetical protein